MTQYVDDPRLDLTLRLCLQLLAVESSQRMVAEMRVDYTVRVHTVVVLVSVND